MTTDTGAAPFDVPYGERPDAIIRHALETAREMLGMDMAYLADTRDGEQAYHTVTGDGDSFGAAGGESVPFEGTYCQLMLNGEIGNVVADSAADPRTADLDITHRGRIGSYIGIPVTLPNGELYGTFCCLSHAPTPELRERDVRFLMVLARLLGDTLEREGREARRQQLALTDGSVTALMAALEARDGYTEAHSVEVVALALEVGRELGLAAEQLADLEHAAVLHDIGKIGVPDAVLRKPGKLDEDEWQVMREHPKISEQIVQAMPNLRHLAPVLRAEHERWDGGGYPDGLAGEAIPMLSRIVFACDAYHAMASDRPYRKALPPEVVREELERNAGTQFDPAVVRALLAVLERRGA